jgi:hypothetical protein
LEQEKEEELLRVIQYLQIGDLPEEERDQKRILAKAMMYGIGTKGGVLIRYEGKQRRSRFDEETDEYGDLPELVVVPKHMTGELMEQYHSTSLGGHFGSKKLLANLRRKYFWETMYSDCQAFCRECGICQKYKVNQQRKVPLHPIPPISPFARVNIDFLCAMQTSKRGNKYMLVFVDHFTKWPEAVAVPDQKAETAAYWFEKLIIDRHSCPREVLSDQGTHFTAKLFRELMARFQISKVFSTANHSQTNGQVERFNRTLLQTMRCYIEKMGIVGTSIWSTH